MSAVSQLLPVPPPDLQHLELLDASFGNHTNADGFNAGQAGRPVLYGSGAVRVQRVVSRGLVIELDYTGSHGAHLGTDPLNPNQVSMDVVNDLIAKHGATALLNSSIASAAA